jgi:hypothetical protein
MFAALPHGQAGCLLPGTVCEPPVNTTSQTRDGDLIPLTDHGVFGPKQKGARGPLFVLPYDFRLVVGRAVLGINNVIAAATESATTTARGTTTAESAGSIAEPGLGAGTDWFSGTLSLVNFLLKDD